MKNHCTHRAFFTELSDQWDAMFSHDDSKLQHFTDLLNISQGQRIVDLGCGTGVFTSHLLKRYGDDISIVCMDISEGMLQEARQKFCRNEKVLLIQGSAEDRCIASHSVDRIICYSCFPHIRDKKKALIAQKEMLKEGGLLVIAHGSSYQEVNCYHRKCEGLVRHDYLPDPGEMTSLLHESGFCSVAVENMPHHYSVTASVC